MQNSTFLVLLRPIFAPKMKTTPQRDWVAEVCEGLAVIWTRKLEFFGLTEFWWRPFLLFFVFRDHLISAGKTVSEEGEDLFFFGDHLISAGKTISTVVKTNKNLGQVRWLLFSPLKNPPFAKSWLRAWLTATSDIIRIQCFLGKFLRYFNLFLYVNQIAKYVVKRSIKGP